MWDDYLAPFWIIKDLFLSAQSSWTYSFGCWGGSYMNSLPPESPKEEMVLLKLKRGVKSAAAVCEQNFLPWLEFIVFMLVENFGGKSKWICPNQGHEEIFPSDEISFACSSINVCIITYF